MSSDLTPDPDRWAILAAAVSECIGERERSLLTFGEWVDPQPVACERCGGPLLTVERVDVTAGGVIVTSRMEAYYRIGTALGSDVLYRTHDEKRCWREHLRRMHQEGAI